MARRKKTADTDVPTSLGTVEPAPLIPAASPDESGPPAAEHPTLEQTDPVPQEARPVDPAEAQEYPQVAAESTGTSELKLVPAGDEEDGDGDLSEGPAPAEDTEPQFIDPAAPEITTQQVIEAILFTADTPLTLPRIVSLLGIGSARDVKKHIEALNQRYVSENATFRIEKIAGGYQMLTLPQFNTWLRRLRQSRQDSRFSAAALETLSVVAYKQPVTRADIEAIRGVAAGEMLNRLRELNLVKIVGRAEDVGRPMLYGTTKRFLEVFGLASLDELPQVEQLQLAQ